LSPGGNDLTQWSDNKMLTSAKHVLIALHDTDVSYEEHRSDWSHQVSAMATTGMLQCDHTLSSKGVGCEINEL